MYDQEQNEEEILFMTLLYHIFYINNLTLITLHLTSTRIFPRMCSRHKHYAVVPCTTQFLYVSRVCVSSLHAVLEISSSSVMLQGGH